MDEFVILIGVITMFVSLFYAIGGLGGNAMAGLAAAILWAGAWTMIGLGVVAMAVNRLRKTLPAPK